MKRNTVFKILRKSIAFQVDYNLVYPYYERKNMIYVTYVTSDFLTYEFYIRKKDQPLDIPFKNNAFSLIDTQGFTHSIIPLFLKDLSNYKEV